MQNMKHITANEAVNLALAMGLTVYINNLPTSKLGLIKFVREIQAHTLKNFAEHLRRSAPKDESITWAAAALEAEFQQEYLGAVTV